MTSVVACGNGRLSGGFYRGLASEARLSQAAERAARAGLVVCAAVGNKGHEPGYPVLPPASAPSALTVGALDDHNRLAFSGYGLYHSSYGPTVDGLCRLEAATDGELRSVLMENPGVDADLDAARGRDARALRGAVHPEKAVLAALEARRRRDRGKERDEASIKKDERGALERPFVHVWRMIPF